MSVSGFMVNYWMWIILAIAAAAVLFLNSARMPSFRYVLDRMKLRIPITGKMNRTVYSARFARSMSILYASGIPLITSLRLSSNVLGNLYICLLYTSIWTRAACWAWSATLRII